MNLNSQLYQSLLNSVNDMVFIYNVRGDHQAVNNIAIDRLDYTEKELLSMNQRELHSQQYEDRVRSKLQEIEEERHVSFESEYVSKWGKTFPVKVLTSSLTIFEEPLILSVVRDLTEVSLIAIEDVLGMLREDLERASKFSKDPLDLKINEYELVHTIEKALRRFKGDIIRKGLIVKKDFSKPLKTSYDEDRIIYVLWNILKTVIQNTQEHIWIRGEKNKEEIQITIKNRGSLFKWEDISDISTLKKIIKAHNGTLHKEKPSEEENLITLTLPIS